MFLSNLRLVSRSTCGVRIGNAIPPAHGEEVPTSLGFSFTFQSLPNLFRSACRIFAGSPVIILALGSVVGSLASGGFHSGGSCVAMKAFLDVPLSLHVSLSCHIFLRSTPLSLEHISSICRMSYTISSQSHLKVFWSSPAVDIMASFAAFAILFRMSISAFLLSNASPAPSPSVSTPSTLTIRILCRICSH